MCFIDKQIMFYILGYWHIKMHPKHETFMGIHIIMPNGQILNLESNVLRLFLRLFFFLRQLILSGVSDAVFIFTAVLKPIIAKLHLLSIRSSIYIE